MAERSFAFLFFSSTIELKSYYAFSFFNFFSLFEFFQEFLKFPSLHKLSVLKHASKKPISVVLKKSKLYVKLVDGR